ncbi:MAG: hypothetical protein WKF58_20315 [Ilumatobacteraceae bacterium]
MGDGRKPPGVTWESWVERSIREGIERGELDVRSGRGEPIADIDHRRADGWFAERLARREQVDDLHRRWLCGVRCRTASQDRRCHVGGRGARHRRCDQRAIRYVNSHTVAGLPSTVMPLDLDVVVEHWSASSSCRTDADRRPPPSAVPSSIVIERSLQLADRPISDHAIGMVRRARGERGTDRRRHR